MSWITGLNTQISKPCLQESGAHIEAEIVLDVGLGALQQDLDPPSATHPQASEDALLLAIPHGWRFEAAHGKRTEG